MKNKFDLRQFLTENKLTRNSKTINESHESRIGMWIANNHEENLPREEYDDYGTETDCCGAEFADDTDICSSCGEHADAAEYDEDDMNTVYEAKDFVPPSKLIQVAQQAWAEKDLGKAKQIIVDLIEPSKVKSKDVILQTIKALRTKTEFDRYLANSILKFEKLGLNEAKMTGREKRLVEMVDQAMGRPIQRLTPIATEGEDLVAENPLEKYKGKNVDEIMKEIEYGTNEQSHKYKMEEMKNIADALEQKVTSLEEGENAEHIDQKAVKQMRKDIMALRKGEEKLRREFDKKFNRKKKAPGKEKPVEVALAENRRRVPKIRKTNTNTNTMEKTFDLKKFLVENKLTTNSRQLKENWPHDGEEEYSAEYEADFAAAKAAVAGGKKLASHDMPEAGATSTYMKDFINDPENIGRYLYWYTEDGEETGIVEVVPEEALQIVKSINWEGEMPDSVPQAFEGELYFVPVNRKTTLRENRRRNSRQLK